MNDMVNAGAPGASAGLLGFGRDRSLERLDRAVANLSAAGNGS